jgi:hypothetical protein
MANTTIPQLPLAVGLDGTEQLQIVQGGTSKRTTVGAISGSGGGSGSVTSVNVSGGSTGLTTSGGPVTSSGTITISGTLNVTSGGTNATTAAGARVNILPSYTGNASKVLAVNSGATDVEWVTAGGTVTSVAALTLGTVGTDLSSTVANGTTTPVITLNVPTASASARGALNSTDWSTFNGKQAALVSGANIKTVGGTSLLGSGDVGTIGVGYGGTGVTGTPTNGQLLIGNGTGFTLASLTAGTNITITPSSGGITIAAAGGGGSMIYPGAGIANSTGSAWGTSYSTSGSGTALALTNSPTFITPALGTPASGVVTNLTGTASININGTVGATTPTTGAFTTVALNSNSVNTILQGSASASATTYTLPAAAPSVTGYVLSSTTGGAMSWVANGAGGVSTFSAGTTGFLPNTNTSGAVTLSGTLNVANGGTGVTSSSGANSVMLRDANQNVSLNNIDFGYSTFVTAAGTTVLTVASPFYIYFTGTATQTVQMPVTSTLALGWSYHIANNSTVNLTVVSSGGNAIGTIIPGVTMHVTCIDTTVTTAAGWDYGTTDFESVTGTGSVVMSTTPTFITNLTSPLVIGGSAVSSPLTLQSTSAAGTSDYIAFKTGSQVERMRISNAGGVSIGTSVDAGAKNILVDGAAKLTSGSFVTSLQGSGSATASSTYTLPVAAPGTTGYVLSSTTGGVMSWVANGGGSMVYPSSAGIVYYDGMGWGASYTTTGTGTVVALANAPTFTSSIISPLVDGGTGAASNLVLQSTSGTGTSDYIAFNTGSQVERMRISTNGRFGFGTTTTNAFATFTAPATSVAAWGTGGVALVQSAATFTDTSTTSLITDVRMNVFGAQTFAASNVITATTLYGTYFTDPVAGTNVTATAKYAIGADSIRVTNGTNLVASGGNFAQIATGTTTGQLVLGNASMTGAITIGQSTVSQTTNIQAGITASGSTKTINIGTNGASGSNTQITLGAAAGSSNVNLSNNTTLTFISNGFNTSLIGSGSASQSVAYSLPPAAPAVTGYVLSSTTGGVMSWVANGGGSMVYPSAGIAVSTGSAWTTSLTAPSSTIVGISDTQTLTNKTVTQRAVAAAATTGNITPNSDTTDLYLALGLTGTTNFQIPSGSPTNGQKLTIRIKDNGTARTLTWVTTAGGYRIIGTTLPTTTVASKTIYVGCVYNTADAFWDVVAVSTEV